MKSYGKKKGHRSLTICGLLNEVTKYLIRRWVYSIARTDYRLSASVGDQLEVLASLFLNRQYAADIVRNMYS